MSQEQYEITKVIMDDDDKVLQFEYDHNMKKLDVVCDTIGSSFRGSLLCDIEIIDRFGTFLDEFGIQDGETRNMSSNHMSVKELMEMIMIKFRENSN